MKFFVDENVPQRVSEYLISKGHNVFDIRKTSLEGSDDLTIFQLAQKKKAIFITTDKDFFHTIPIQIPEHYGIIVIALKQPSGEKILEKIKWAIEHLDFSKIKSRIFVFRDRHYIFI